MNLDAWQTIWACVGLSLFILGLDGFLANRSGPSKTDLVRQAKRDNRAVVVNKSSNGGGNE